MVECCIYPRFMGKGLLRGGDYIISRSEEPKELRAEEAEEGCSASFGPCDQAAPTPPSKLILSLVKRVFNSSCSTRTKLQLQPSSARIHGPVLLLLLLLLISDLLRLGFTFRISVTDPCYLVCLISILFLLERDRITPFATMVRIILLSSGSNYVS